MKKKSSKAPRVVIVSRPTEYEALLATHATHGQVAFFLETREQSVEAVVERHERQMDAMQRVSSGVPLEWRRAVVQRSQLDRFLWDPDDVVVAVGQDGLVANVAKYLEGQPVVGINPDPSRYDGVLVRHDVAAGLERARAAQADEAELEERTMVEARIDGRITLRALNEVFVGHCSHQSARYRIRFDGREERHSSSGLIVTTGTGSTGWARSIWRSRGNCGIDLPKPCEPRTAFFVREAFPSVSTGCEVTEGVLQPGVELEVVSRMNEGGVIFGDGIERDRIEFLWGSRVAIRQAEQVLRLVV